MASVVHRERLSTEDINHRSGGAATPRVKTQQGEGSAIYMIIRKPARSKFSADARARRERELTLIKLSDNRRASV